MAYTLSTLVSLGSSQTGLTLKAILVDTSGSTVGSEVTTGFVELGGGEYLWTYASMPDSHRGAVKFYTGTLPTGYKASAAINPQEAEFCDEKTSAAKTLATGAITAAVIATDAIDADALADNAITAATFAADAITAAKIAADAITEIQSGLATASALDTVDNFLDTEIAAIKAVTDALVAAQSEPSGVPAANATPLEKLAWLYILARNKKLQTATTTTVRNDADDADVATSSVSDDGTTLTRGEWS